MPASVAQLRIGVTRERGFLYRACLRPPLDVTVGHARAAMCPLDDPAAPELHTLFRISGATCVLEYRREWGLTMYRDGRAVGGRELETEGTSVLRGSRALLKLGLGSRGALYIGGTRVLFKWEELAYDAPGAVPLRDVGSVPRCHACGQALTDALAREGLLARCSSCRAMNRFVDPDAPYREERPPPTAPDQPAVDPSGDTEADTLIGMPMFAPVTNLRLEPLPSHLRPAGLPAAEQAPGDPMSAAAGMRTVLGRSPFLGPRTKTRDGRKTPIERRRIEVPTIKPGDLPPGTAATNPAFDPADLPEGVRNPGSMDPADRATVVVAPLPDVAKAAAQAAPEAAKTPPAPEPAPEDALDGSPSAGFWTDEVPATPPEPAPPGASSFAHPITGDVPALDVAFYTSEVEALDFGPGTVVPWGTLTALSARSDFVETSGRIVLGPGREPPPPSVGPTELERSLEAKRMAVNYTVIALMGALVGAAIAVAALIGKG